MSSTVVVTGVLGGVGKELAHVFSESGYQVIGLDCKTGDSVYCNKLIQFDINRYCIEQNYRAEMNALIDKEIPELSVLINNAAVQILGGTAEIKLADWQETLNVNLTGPLLLSQFFLSRLEKSTGCIINIASIHHRLTKKRFVAYATSKSALIGLTKAMAVDLEGRVRVNSISPAAIQTDMLVAGFGGDKDAFKKLNKIHPVQRIGLPSDVARMALFLASENSGFIHGANFSLDGAISSSLKDLD